MINDLQYPDFEIKIFQFSRSETYISKHSRLEQHFIIKKLLSKGFRIFCLCLYGESTDLLTEIRNFFEHFNGRLYSS